ncbi:energy-coupling factor ABC transporter permease [Heliorestis convoluta]|uniref:ABC-type Co2+ transport system permease component-like protein n=1 Tax=Heliorestis convoluta TaxID=356322 RepID=A0A5Q2MZA3_9FIRM|nr:energy-coupling factor ABC transporter permease [Heliorestis convoluta]QGG46773.1 ABC-type Co2+ transport system permease component-like protein [Heliorestis convoluta]
MTHLHFPDGILPLWFVALGFILTAIILVPALQRLKAEEHFARKVSMIALFSALMIIAMSIPLGFIHYHMNLAVLVSLLLGPWYAFISIFVVNTFLSLIGHGGITVVGLNTIILGFEAFLAYYIFSVLRKLLQPYIALFSTVLLSLLSTTAFMLFVVFFATLTTEPLLLAEYLEKGQQLAGGVMLWSIQIILPIAFIGALIEGTVTLVIAKYLCRLKPELMQHLDLRTDVVSLPTKKHRKNPLKVIVNNQSQEEDKKERK